MFIDNTGYDVAEQLLEVIAGVNSLNERHEELIIGISDVNKLTNVNHDIMALEELYSNRMQKPCPAVDFLYENVYELAYMFRRIQGENKRLRAIISDMLGMDLKEIDLAEESANVQ